MYTRRSASAKTHNTHRFIKYTLIVAGVAALGLLVARILMPDYMTPQYLYRTISNGDAEVTDWQHVFPQRAIANDPDQLSPLPEAFANSHVAEALSTVKYSPNGLEASIGPDVQKFMQDTDSNSLLIVKNGQLVYETYAQGTTKDTIHTSMSVAKSFVSALTGIAIQEGRIASVNDPVVRYLPELKGHISDQMTIRHLLTMTAGNAYNGHGGLTGDDTIAYWSPNIREILRRYFKSTSPPGQHMDYNDFQPQVLGMILERVTSMSLSQYLQEKIWKPAGMEYPASWSLDSTQDGFEQTAIGLNARSRDFARFGQLYLTHGQANGQQIVPANWVEESTHSDSTYGYYWWITNNVDGTRDYSARGNHGQFIYVSPGTNTVVVRTGPSVGGITNWPGLLAQIAHLPL